MNGSSLSRMDKPPGAERRTAVRYPCRADSGCVMVISQRRAARWARPRDVSTGGLSLSVAGPFEAGSLALLELSCGPGPLTLLAEVVHTAPQPDGSWTLGCRFDNLRGDLGPAEREQVQALLREWGPGPTDGPAQEQRQASLSAPLRNPLRRLLKGVTVRSRPVQELVPWEQVPESTDQRLDQLYDLLHVARNKLCVRKEATDLAAVAGRALELARPHAAARGEWAVAVVPPEPVGVEADPAWLEWAVSSMILEMVRRSRPDGPIRLTVERAGREGVLRIAADLATELAAPQTLGELLDGSKAHDPAGPSWEAVGLALVRAMVEIHGGSVQAGDEFVVRLPLLPEAALDARCDRAINGERGT